MILEECSFSIPGKWVLSGEHSVLRGGAAIAMPHPEFSMHFQFSPCLSGGLDVDPTEMRNTVFQLIERLRPSFEPEGIQGLLSIQNSIPMGAGLGSSAALCFGLVHWLAEWGGRQDLSISDRVSLARELENTFHGKSSGMDVAAVSARKPIFFKMGELPVELELAELPRFSFHDTGKRAETRECVDSVQKLLSTNSELGVKIDQEMTFATEETKSGLFAFDSGDREIGLATLSSAMKRSTDCFRKWGLLTDLIESQIRQLYRDGALAVKPTGAGRGGFLVALWQ